ncbi:hypothetical protein HAX54_011710 [Datura stramonium]|uniref:F-box associated beta-propeller type 1 domain-containing protein n=1 Tax=Datura stramonium TaxID=4076 RepID=A0ABS8RXS0_DATST|nr:hypothetical protein [Datura stramonium]
MQTNDGIFEFRDSENLQIAMGKRKFPLKRFQHVPALCSCDGLVLLKSHIAYKAYALWNPCTNEYGIYECPYVKPYSGKTPHGCGFCYDSSVDDYKVILIYRSFYAVCYVSKNDWRKGTSVHIQELNARSRDCSPGINVEGRVFWSMDWKVNHLVRRNSRIIYIDVKSDELKELPTPDFIADHDQLYRLTSLKENSVLLGCTNNGEILFQVGMKLQNYVIHETSRLFKPVQISNDSKYYMIPIHSESLYFPKFKANVMRKRKRFG